MTEPAQKRISRWVPIVLWITILVLFAVRNLPWHLDDKDQAKQAYVSFEMVEENHWWFQHTPAEKVATKPPLAGWISAGTYLLTGRTSWDLAWRLPGLLCAVVMLWMIYRVGTRMEGGALTAFSAAAAFGLNHFSQRLATLVRTDMMLTFFIFIAGLLALKKVLSRTAWTSGERWAVFAVILASMMTKGPIAYAFLLPGLVAYWWILRKKNTANFAWAGWWPWCGPLLVFAIWAGIGIWTSEEFYREIVLKEFLGRFTVGEAAVHHNQPIYFYFTQLLVKFLPWAALLIVLGFRKSVREAIASDPARLWLVCWAVGGLIFMSLVPSKRADRIFPVIPPLCLLAGSLLGVVARERRGYCWTIASVVIAVVATVSSATFEIIAGYRQNLGGLVSFGSKARSAAASHPERLVVVSGKDEGMLLYTGKTHFTELDSAVSNWQSGKIDWLVLNDGYFKKREQDLKPFTVLAAVPKLIDKQSGYSLLVRRQGAAKVLQSNPSNGQ